jgi:hypothetical protein
MSDFAARLTPVACQMLGSPAVGNTKRWKCLFLISALSAAAVGVGGCNGEDGSGGDGTGDNADISADCLADFADLSQDLDDMGKAKRMTKTRFSSLHDPVAKMLGTSCPRSLADVTKAITGPGSGCEGDPRNIMLTRTISEDALATGKKTTNFRHILTRGCPGGGNAVDGTDEAALFIAPLEIEKDFSTPGADGKRPADDVIRDRVLNHSPIELIGFQKEADDASSGVFNYYALQNTLKASKAHWNFYGSSKDFITLGAGTPIGGATEVEASQIRRCAQCHPQGGLVMKELKAPWLHWDTTGNGLPQDMVDSHLRLAPEVFGSAEKTQNRQNPQRAPTLQNLVQMKNTAWNTSRVQFLKQQVERAQADPGNQDNKKFVDFRDGMPKSALYALLEPLFCTTEINVFSEDVNGVIGIPDTFLVDEVLAEKAGNVGTLVTMDEAKYDRMIAADKGSVITLRPPIQDTFFKFAFPENAHIMRDYARQLIADGILDDDLVRDILFVDFTRPVFSDQRCDLLKPLRGMELPKDAQLTPATIRELLKLDKGTLADQEAAIANYVQKCQDRADNDRSFGGDLMKVFAAKRARARVELRSRFGVGILPFPNSLGFSDLETCHVVTTVEKTSDCSLATLAGLKDPIVAFDFSPGLQDESLRRASFDEKDCSFTTK